MPEEVFVADAIFKCPFCGLLCSADKKIGVVHEMPLCKKFEELDAEDFVHEAFLKYVPQA